MLTDQLERVGSELDRTVTRRRIVTTGAKLAYAAPLVAVSFKLGAHGAAAASPAPCQHSLGGISGSGCLGACQSAGNTSICNTTCDGCAPGGTNPCDACCVAQGNVCPNEKLCDPACFQCTATGSVFTC
jgi:hypothetical protein